MKVEDAAKLLGMNAQTLRLALQQGLLPIGIAVKTSPNRYTYEIFPKRLQRYLEGADLYAPNNMGFADHNNGFGWDH